MLVDCRELIEFCKAFEQHRNMANSPAILETSYLQQKSNGKPKKGLQPFTSSPPPLCKQSSAAAVDVIILVLVLVACGFLFTPYFRYICTEAAHIFSIAVLLVGEVIHQAPVAYVAVSVLIFAGVLAGWEYYQYRTRKCDNPHCQGLRKAMEFDIRLESEQCVKSPSSEDLRWKGSMELGEDRKKLEAELKRMAPPNGRAVLVLRAPCGCPAAHMEVRGSQKTHRLKKTA